MRYLLGIALILAVMSVYAQAETDFRSQNFIEIDSENVLELSYLAGFDLSYPIVDFEWELDSYRLLVGTQENIWLLDLQNQDLDELLTGYMDNIRFVAGTSQIAMVDDASEPVITLYDLDTAVAVQNTFVSGVTTINQNGTMYASGGLDNVTVYELQSGSLLHDFSVQEYQPCEYACPIHNIAFSQDNNLLAFAAAVPEIESAIVNLITGERISPIEVGGWELQFNVQSTLLVSISGTPGYIPEQVLLTDTLTGRALVTIGLYVSSVTFSRSGELLAIGAYDDNAPNPDEAGGFIYIFNVEELLEDLDAAPVMTLQWTRPPLAIEFSSDDRLIAVSNVGGQMSILGIPSSSE